jgi:phospholipase C
MSWAGIGGRVGRVVRTLARLLGPLLRGKQRQIALKVGERPLSTPTGRVRVTFDAEADNLRKIDHVVVLMLENRSFDHMLGYLSLTGGRTDVDGLKGGEVNHHEGRAYEAHLLDRTALDGEAEDPPHDGGSVDDQLADGNGGFVRSYAAYLAHRTPRPDPMPDLGLPMGHYDADALPVYDHLAREFCVCDRWFSSVPGATWPNRLYAMTGRAAGSRDDVSPPLYNLVSFPRHLTDAGVDWRWYSYDPGTLRLADRAYTFECHGHFSYFDRRKLSAKEELVGRVIEEGSFLDDAAAGKLPPVSWIDPHFKDLAVFGPDSNDDHPPSDVLAGQALVLDLYHALRTSPAWERTLLVITYDEHGGFYDHVAPPEAPDDDPAFRRYGVRVPAIIVSPWVEAGVASHTPFDHTSIIKTILMRFCAQGDTIPDMGLRTTQANHLGGLLSRAAPRADVASHADAVDRIAGWRAELTRARFAPQFAPPVAPRPLSDLQDEMARAARVLRENGLPAGHP